MKKWLVSSLVAALLAPLPALAGDDSPAELFTDIFAGPAEPAVEQPNIPDNPLAGGTRAVLFDNGPFETGPTAGGGCAGSQSLLQNVTLCLNSFGLNTTFEGTTIYAVADDFRLGTNATVDSITVIAYESGATSATITGGRMRIHTAMPTDSEASPFTRESTSVVVTLTTIYRQTQDTPGCTRRFQRVKFNFAPPLALNAGTYWASWRLTGSASFTGPWTPPVTIIGQTAKPGANALQTANGGGFFNPAVDNGIAGCVPAPPQPNPQDFPMIVEGTPTGGGCAGDADDDGDTDQDDIDMVLFNYGNIVPPNTNGDLDGNGVVNQDDIDIVLFDYGCHP